MNNIEIVIRNIRLLQSKLNEGIRVMIRENNLNLTIREVKYLSVVAQYEGKRKTDILRYLGVTRATASNIIKYLIEKRYVTQTESKTDARSKNLKLTILGKTTYKIFAKMISKFFKDSEEKLSEKEVKELIRLTNRIVGL